jgi:hypothetical protein
MATNVSRKEDDLLIKGKISNIEDGFLLHRILDIVFQPSRLPIGHWEIEHYNKAGRLLETYYDPKLFIDKFNTMYRAIDSEIIETLFREVRFNFSTKDGLKVFTTSFLETVDLDDDEIEEEARIEHDPAFSLSPPEVYYVDLNELPTTRDRQDSWQKFDGLEWASSKKALNLGFPFDDKEGTLIFKAYSRSVSSERDAHEKQIESGLDAEQWAQEEGMSIKERIERGEKVERMKRKAIEQSLREPVPSLQGDLERGQSTLDDFKQRRRKELVDAQEQAILELYKDIPGGPSRAEIRKQAEANADTEISFFKAALKDDPEWRQGQPDSKRRRSEAAIRRALIQTQGDVTAAAKLLL